MASKRMSSPAIYGPPKPKTPIGKLQEKISRLHSIASSADPEASYPPSVRAPKHIEDAANLVSDHIDGVISGAKQSLTGAMKVRPKRGVR